MALGDFTRRCAYVTPERFVRSKDASLMAGFHSRGLTDAVIEHVVRVDQDLWLLTTDFDLWGSLESTKRAVNYYHIREFDWFPDLAAWRSS